MGPGQTLPHSRPQPFLPVERGVWFHHPLDPGTRLIGEPGQPQVCGSDAAFQTGAAGASFPEVIRPQPLPRALAQKCLRKHENP